MENPKKIPIRPSFSQFEIQTLINSVEYRRYCLPGNSILSLNPKAKLLFWMQVAKAVNAVRNRMESPHTIGQIKTKYFTLIAESDRIMKEMGLSPVRQINWEYKAPKPVTVSPPSDKESTDTSPLSSDYDEEWEEKIKQKRKRIEEKKIKAVNYVPPIDPALNKVPFGVPLYYLDPVLKPMPPIEFGPPSPDYYEERGKKFFGDLKNPSDVLKDISAEDKSSDES